jgi:hypothetical protein
MRIVGRVLAQLPDAEARMRVLDWAAGRFAHATSPNVNGTARRQPHSCSDLALSMEGIEGLFVESDGVAAGEICETEGAAWDSDARGIRTPARQGGRLESLVDGFVSRFQRVAAAGQSV